MAQCFCCTTQNDTDSGSSSLNASREDLCEACPTSSLPGSPPTPEWSPVAPPKSSISLPGYSASLPVPDYHPNPTGSEQRLEFVPSRSVYGRSAGVWTKRVKDTTISLHNQDPIEVQRAPRYGKRGNIVGTVEFDEENLAHFEKVKLVVRLPIIYAGKISFG